MAAKQDSATTKYGHLVRDQDEQQRIPDTHRAFDSFPHGTPGSVTIDDLPDKEIEFVWTNHYEDESRQRTDPDVTGALVEELLTTGVVREPVGDKFDDRYLVQKKIDGYEWMLVVARDEGDSDMEWALITIFSNYHGSVGVTNRYFDRLRQRRGDRA